MHVHGYSLCFDEHKLTFCRTILPYFPVGTSYLVYSDAIGYKTLYVKYVEFPGKGWPKTHKQ